MARHARISFVLWAFLIGCDGSDGGPPLPDPGPDSGLDLTQSLSDLSDEEAGDLCDWIAGRFGGYGRRRTCSDGSFVGSQQNQQACINDWKKAPLTCDLTVETIENCINGVVIQATCTGLPFDCYELLFCAIKPL